MGIPRLITLSLCRKCVSNTITKCSDQTKRLVFGENSTTKLNCVLSNLNAKFNLMGLVFAEQCNRVITFRVRRSFQILKLYERIYGENVLMERLQRIKVNLGRSSFNKGKPLSVLLSAAVFDWEKNRISNEEINRQV